jgi:hypothetical protein
MCVCVCVCGDWRAVRGKANNVVYLTKYGEQGGSLFLFFLLTNYLLTSYSLLYYLFNFLLVGWVGGWV